MKPALPLERRRRFVATASALTLLGLGYGAGLVAAGTAAPRARVIKMSARRFAYTPNHLTVKKGTPVVLELTSVDVLMGINIPDLNVRADIVPGKVTHLRFVPDKAGTFVFLCDIFCGSGHEQMQGTLTVVA
jgi:cytochrome c oxidase subunit 2